MLNLLPGEECTAMYKSKQYRAKILAIGKAEICFADVYVHVFSNVPFIIFSLL